MMKQILLTGLLAFGIGSGLNAVNDSRLLPYIPDYRLANAGEIVQTLNSLEQDYNVPTKKYVILLKQSGYTIQTAAVIKKMLDDYVEYLYGIGQQQQADRITTAKWYGIDKLILQDFPQLNNKNTLNEQAQLFMSQIFEQHMGAASQP